MQITRTEPVEEKRPPLEPADMKVPEPGPGQVRIKVRACGVCYLAL